MTPTYEQVVEKVARDMYDTDRYYGSYDTLTSEQKEILIRAAGGAIRAIQDIMPEVKYWVSGGFKNDVTVSNGNELYNHFKMMGRK
jgi:hypothetical protein